MIEQDLNKESRIAQTLIEKSNLPGKVNADIIDNAGAFVVDNNGVQVVSSLIADAFFNGLSQIRQTLVELNPITQTLLKESRITNSEVLNG